MGNQGTSTLIIQEAKKKERKSKVEATQVVEHPTYQLRKGRQGRRTKVYASALTCCINALQGYQAPGLKLLDKPEDSDSRLKTWTQDMPASAVGNGA